MQMTWCVAWMMGARLWMMCVSCAVGVSVSGFKRCGSVFVAVFFFLGFFGLGGSSRSRLWLSAARSTRSRGVRSCLQRRWGVVQVCGDEKWE